MTPYIIVEHFACLFRQGHSVGVFLGNVIPGVTTQQEFVAGTLTRVRTSRFMPTTSIFQDPAGRKMFLFERMFRYPADFNRLLGIQDFKRDKEEVGGSEETF